MAGLAIERIQHELWLNCFNLSPRSLNIVEGAQPCIKFLEIKNKDLIVQQSIRILFAQ
jgi:hypothetical protein